MPSSALLGLSHDALWNANVTHVDPVGIGAGPSSLAFPLGNDDAFFPATSDYIPPPSSGTFCESGDLNFTGGPAELNGALPRAMIRICQNVQGGTAGKLGLILVGSDMDDP